MYENGTNLGNPRECSECERFNDQLSRAEGQIERLEIELTAAREKGFHEGKEFALLTISNAVLGNIETPALALSVAIKALRDG